MPPNDSVTKNLKLKQESGIPISLSVCEGELVIVDDLSAPRCPPIANNKFIFSREQALCIREFLNYALV